MALQLRARRNLLMIVAATVIAAGSGMALAQGGQMQPPPPPATPDHSAMMAQHQQMMAHLQAMDEKLDALMTTMHQATGDAKVEAMATVLDELVAQRREMVDMVQQHMPMMMHHMEGMQGMHGMQGMPMGEGMSCPCMKQKPGAATTGAQNQTQPMSDCGCGMMKGEGGSCDCTMDGGECHCPGMQGGSGS